MYFTSIIRFSPEHGSELPYYKIKESFRDLIGRVHTRVMLTPGYLPNLCSAEIVQIRRGLTYLMELAYRNVRKKWTMPIANWAIIAQQLAIKFGDRLILI